MQNTIPWVFRLLDIFLGLMGGSQSLATAYVNTWKSLAMPSGSQQILYTYGASGSSYALQYNLFADKWLGTGLVDDAVSIMVIILPASAF